MKASIIIDHTIKQDRNFSSCICLTQFRFIRFAASKYCEMIYDFDSIVLFRLTYN